MAEKEVQSRKTVISRSITRKINTAQFETLDVSTTVQQEIVWHSKDELWDKSRALDTYALKDFEETFVTVLNTLGVQSIQGTTAAPKGKPGPSNGSQEEFDQI